MKGEYDKTSLSRDEPRVDMPALGVKSIAQLKSIHTSAHSMGNKATNRRKPLAAGKLWHSPSPKGSGMTHGWRTATMVIMVLQYGQQWNGFVHQGVFHCTEPKERDDTVEWLWVRFRGKAEVLVGACYRLHNQNEEADEVFHTSG